jgi:hypothetical protein
VVNRIFELIMAPQKKKGKTTQPRARRLHRAKDWIAAYSGKTLVSAYAKHFRVDLPCAIKELRLMGVPVTEQYEQVVMRTLAMLALQKNRKQLEKELEAMGTTEFGDWDTDFIAGYTGGGASYGLTAED